MLLIRRFKDVLLLRIDAATHLMVVTEKRREKMILLYDGIVKSLSCLTLH
jgi:hypothetical protein